MEDRLETACTRWGLTAPRLVAETPRARVFRVQRGAGAAALKLLTPEGATSEAAAPALLRHWSRHGAVGLLEAADDALLLDWLPGPSLGLLAREDDDAQASRILARVAACLAACLAAGPAPQGRPAGVVPLARWLRALLDHPAPTADMAKARALARDLLAEARPERLLHGDLHHDNVLQDRAGAWRVIDPKGVFGEPEFDLANAFRNPVGRERAAADPVRMSRMADIFAAETGASAHRLLAWAAVQAALSIAWNGPGPRPSPDHAILATALALANRHARD